MPEHRLGDAPGIDTVSICAGFMLCQLFFAGFVIRQPSMPAYWRDWAPYVDFMSYGWHAQMTNEFEGRPDVLLNGVPVLEFYNITDSKWASLGYEATFFLGLFCFAWLVRAPILSIPPTQDPVTSHRTGTCLSRLQCTQALTFCKHSRR